VERKHLNKLVGGESKKPMEDMTVAAIAGDKGRVIRGQVTSIVSHVNIITDLRDAQDRLRKAGGIIDIEHDDS
jgi:hypothetical protein